MADSLLDRAVVPVASKDDAVHTLAGVLPRFASLGGHMTVVHVIEKAGGSPDKAPLEQREELAEELFAYVRERAEAAGVAVDTELVYATDVAEAIVETAHEVDATAIVFTPREGKGWWDLFAPDVSGNLLEGSDLPVVVFPDALEGTGDGETGESAEADDETTGSSGAAGNDTSDTGSAGGDTA